MAFSGAGSIVGALIVAWLGKFPKMGWTALIVQAVYGLLIIAFAVSRVLWLSDILLFLHRRGADGGVLDGHLAGPDDRAQRDARARDEHLHAGVPRRHAARQPGQRLSGDLSSARRWSSASTARCSSSSRSISCRATTECWTHDEDFRLADCRLADFARGVAGCRWRLPRSPLRPGRSRGRSCRSTQIRRRCSTSAPASG